jgi:invasion protein IalB
MNLSLDRWQTFRSLVGSALLAGFALAMGATLAVAQEGQSVLKTTTPKAVPAARATAPAAASADAPAAGPEAGQANGSAWVKLCSNNEQTGFKQVCIVKYEGVDPNTGTVLVTAAVRSVEGEDKQDLLVGVTTTATLVIPVGVQIKFDDGQPISLKYATCLPPSCQAQTELTREIFDNMRKGKQMVVAAMNVQQKTMGFQVPLIGFGKTYDGLSADNAKYEEARRQMAEKFRQRQIELAKKAAEQPPAGAPPQP